MSLGVIHMKGFEQMFKGACVIRLFGERYAPLKDVAEALGVTEAVAGEALAQFQAQRAAPPGVPKGDAPLFSSDAE